MARRRHSPRGPSQRQLRVGETVRHALSRLFERGAIHDPELAGIPVTVAEVTMSPDLRVATVYVLPLGAGDAERDAAVAALGRVGPALRRMLGPMVTLKFLPELRFVADTRFDRAERIETLLDRARVHPGEPDGDGAPDGDEA